MTLPESLKRIPVEVNGQTLMTYQTMGSAMPSLVCIHGGPGFDSRSLWPGMLSLSKIFNLVFVDLRGHGESSAPKDKDYKLTTYADDVIQIAKTLKGSVGLLGHSFGGCVAIETLARQESPFQFGILVDAPIDDRWTKSIAEVLKRPEYQHIQDAEDKFNASSKSDSDWKSVVCNEMSSGLNWHN